MLWSESKAAFKESFYCSESLLCAVCQCWYLVKNINIHYASHHLVLSHVLTFKNPHIDLSIWQILLWISLLLSREIKSIVTKSYFQIRKKSFCHWNNEILAENSIKRQVKNLAIMTSMKVVTQKIVLWYTSVDLTLLIWSFYSNFGHLNLHNILEHLRHLLHIISMITLLWFLWQTWIFCRFISFHHQRSALRWSIVQTVKKPKH